MPESQTAQPAPGGPPPETPPPSPTEAGTVDWIVNVTIAQATTRTERRFAWLRMSFCLVSLAVFFLHQTRFPGDVQAAQVALELTITGLGIGLSVWVLEKTRSQLTTDGLKVLSAGFDAVLVVAALAGNQLSPSGTYTGLLGSMDVAIAPLAVLTSVLRVSPRAVLASSVIVTTGITVLLAIDAARDLPVSPKLPLFAVYLGAAVFLSYYFTARAREIFGRVGQVAVRAEGARQSVRALLEDHHDLRSVLCNLQLGADRLHEALVRGDERERLEALEGSLSTGIAALTKGAASTRNRALLALEGADQPSVASVEEALAEAVREAATLAPGLTIVVEPSAKGTPVLFGGGTTALSRLFLHLLVNAKEGDGKRGATTARITTQARRGAVDVDVTDDGPGFPAALLDKVGRDRGYTTKIGSSGIGLWLAHSSLLAAGGSLALSNDGGACVRVLLRAAP